MQNKFYYNYNKILSIYVIVNKMMILIEETRDSGEHII